MSFWLYVLIGFIAVVLLALAGNDIGRQEKRKGYIKKKKIFLVLSFLLLLFIVIFRDTSVGTDYEIYINLYNRIYTGYLYVNDINWIGYPCYLIIKAYTILFGDNYFIFFSSLSLLALILLYKTIINESKIPWLSLLIFISFCLYYQMFNQFRQMTAIIITFYAFRYMKENNFKKYLFWILLASCLHPSALIMIPTYLLRNIKITKQSILIYIISGISVFLGYSVILEIISLTSYGSSYLGSYREISFSVATILNLGVRIIMLAFCLFYKNNYLKEDSKGNIIYNLLFLCIILQLLTIRSSVIARITVYFFIYFIIAIPNTLSYLKLKTKQLYLSLIVLVLFACHYIYYHSDSGAVICGYDKYKLIELKN